MPYTRLLSLSINYDYDLVVARRRVRQIAERLGFSQRESVTVGAVTAELVRNALRQGGGRCELGLSAEADDDVLVVSIAESSPHAEASEYESSEVIAAVRPLMDEVVVSNSPDKATTVTVRKRLRGRSARGESLIAEVAAAVAQVPVGNPFAEIEQQNRELLEALVELTRLEKELQACGTRVAQSEPGSVAGGAGDVPPLRLLLIDDDELARYAIARFAARPGLEVIEAINGLDGLALAQQAPPDIIFLDLRLPGIGGHEVLQRLADEPATARVPVVVITSRFLNEAERRDVLALAADVIYKSDLSAEVVSGAITKATGQTVATGAR